MKHILILATGSFTYPIDSEDDEFIYINTHYKIPKDKVEPFDERRYYQLTNELMVEYQTEAGNLILK